MAKSPKKEILIDKVIATPGTAKLPFSFKRLSEVMPDLKSAPWRTVKSVQDLRLEKLNIEDKPGTSILFILQKNELLDLPRPWLRLIVYDLRMTVIVEEHNILTLYNTELDNETDEAEPFKERQNQGPPFSKVALKLR